MSQSTPSKEDTGKASDTVYATHSGRGKKVYHEDKDCPYSPDDQYCQEWTRRYAERSGYAPCPYCILGESPGGDNEGEDAPQCTVQGDNGEQCGKSAVIKGMCVRHYRLQ
jgi:hypothetical protein